MFCGTLGFRGTPVEEHCITHNIRGFVERLLTAAYTVLGGRMRLSKQWLRTTGLATVREMYFSSQHCCDKTMDDKMALYRECCFHNFIKLW